MIGCPKHGNGAITLVCPDVAQAVWDKVACPGIERLAHFGCDHPALILEGWFCPACVAGHKLPPSGPLADPDAFISAYWLSGKAYQP